MKRFWTMIKSRFPGKELGRDERGLAAIELALTLPFLVLLFFGVVDLSQAISANKKITQATNTMADLITQAAGKVTKAEIDGVFNAARPILDPFPHEAFGVTIIALKPSGSGNTPEVRWIYNNGGMTCTTGDYKQKAKPLMSNGNDVIFAVGCIKVPSLVTAFFSRDELNLHSTVYLRPRQSDELTCEGCS